MAQGFLFRTKLLHSTVLLCVPLLLSLPLTEVHAAPESQESNPNVIPRASGVNAYRARRIQARAESYQQRKQFPPAEKPAETVAEQPPEMVETKHAAPLKVVIPNLVESPAPAAETRGTRMVTRDSPAYKYLANQQHDDVPNAAAEAASTPIADQLAEAGSAVTSALSDAGSSLLSAILPDSQEQASDVDNIALPQMQLAATDEPPAPAQNAEPPAAPPATENSENAAQPQPDAKPIRYFSPGIIIKREVVRLPIDPEALASASPEQLALLSPAAGESASTMDSPLIQIPSTNESAAEPEPESPPAAPEITPLVAPEASTPVPPPVTATPATTNDTQATELPSTPAAPVEQLPSIEPTTASQPDEKALPESTPPAAALDAELSKEEPEALSPKSKQIMQSLPSMADEKSKEPLGFDIDRSKETGDVFEANVQEAGEIHEAAGVKLEVRTPAMNINYELEKAYNALLSGQSNAAITIYKEVLKNDPLNEDALFGLATTYHRAGQIEAARPLYGKLLAQNPSHRSALNNFLVLVADEAPQEALLQLEALEKKSPDFSPIPAQMAVIYQKNGDFAKASEKMFKAVSLAPENLTYRYNLAILMDKQRNYEEATKLYGQLVQAHARGEVIPGNITAIQERLTFLRSNKH